MPKEIPLPHHQNEESFSAWETQDHRMRGQIFFEIGESINIEETTKSTTIKAPDTTPPHTAEAIAKSMVLVDLDRASNISGLQIVKQQIHSSGAPTYSLRDANGELITLEAGHHVVAGTDGAEERDIALPMSSNESVKVSLLYKKALIGADENKAPVYKDMLFIQALEGSSRVSLFENRNPSWRITGGEASLSREDSKKNRDYCKFTTLPPQSTITFAAAVSDGVGKKQGADQAAQQIVEQTMGVFLHERYLINEVVPEQQVLAHDIMINISAGIPTNEYTGASGTLAAVAVGTKTREVFVFSLGDTVVGIFAGDKFTRITVDDNLLNTCLRDEQSPFSPEQLTILLNRITMITHNSNTREEFIDQVFPLLEAQQVNFIMLEVLFRRLKGNTSGPMHKKKEVLGLFWDSRNSITKAAHPGNIANMLQPTQSRFSMEADTKIVLFSDGAVLSDATIEQVLIYGSNNRLNSYDLAHLLAGVNKLRVLHKMNAENASADKFLANPDRLPLFNKRSAFTNEKLKGHILAAYRQITDANPEEFGERSVKNDDITFIVAQGPVPDSRTQQYPPRRGKQLYPPTAPEKKRSLVEAG